MLIRMVVGAMSQGCGFVLSGNPVRFVGWESKLSTMSLAALAPILSTPPT